jgi:dihydroorotate dehydrogenase (fumarate)
MAVLSTKYMGLELKNPVVVAASALSSKVDNIVRAEEAGAGALVIRSLFEEQIRHEIGQLDEALAQGAESYAEALSYFPAIEHGEAKEHLFWVERSRAATKMPLIGSLNAVSAGSWVKYAKQLADTGVNALELNYYSVEADMDRAGADVEKAMLEIVASVRQEVSLPIAVKISPFYSSVANLVKQLEEIGVNGVVMFNRFLQPEIDPDREEVLHEMTYSTAAEMRVPLRWIGLLYGRTGLDMAANTGVMEARDVVKCLLAGAAVTQVASTLFRNGIGHLTSLVGGLNDWMDQHGYANVEDFRGKLSQANFTGNAVMFERAQYLDFLMQRQRWVKS